MRFLMLIRVDEHGPETAPPASLIEAVDAYRSDTTNGRLLDDGGLMPSSESVLVATEQGRVTVVDGPFAEAKEVVGGFFLVESASPDHMTAWARGFVDLHAEHWPQLAYVAEVRQVAGPPED